jgi:uncharacterized protein YxjI
VHSTFVVDQKPKLIELRNEYSIYDGHGNRIGSVMQVGQPLLTRVLRLLIKADSLLSVKLEIHEASGAVALLVHKPTFRITCSVSRPNGALLGRIAPKIRLGKVRMAITDPAGSVLGEVRAENLRAWDFNVQDANGRLIARVDKKGPALANSSPPRTNTGWSWTPTSPTLCAARWSPPVWRSIRCSSSRTSLIPHRTGLTDES